MARILIIANALHSGGAEQTIATLAMDLNRDHDVRIYVIREFGPVGEELRRNGVEVAPGPGKSGRIVANIAMLPIYMTRFRPQYIVSFLYVSDVVGGVFGKLFAPDAKIVWNIRNNFLHNGQIGRFGSVALKLACKLARVVPHQIVYCSSNARLEHEAAGYPPDRGLVAENSAAAVAFRYDHEKRVRMRAENAIRGFAFAFIARYTPIKRVDVFIAACQQYLQTCSDVTFVFAGRDMDAANRALVDALETAGLLDSSQLLGYIGDRSALYSSVDALVVTSESEGSPNVVYEAQATDLPILMMPCKGAERICGPALYCTQTRSVSELVELMRKVHAGTKAAPPRAGFVRPTARPAIVDAYRTKVL